MKTEPELCPTCGGKMVEYTHSLSKSLVRAFYKAFRASDSIGSFKVSQLPGMSHSQLANLQKLRYWDMIRKAPNSNAKGGEWIITRRGRDFIEGRISLSKKVITYRAEVVKFEGVQVSVQDVTGGWKYRPDYAREGRPHPPPDRPTPPDQGGLF